MKFINNICGIYEILSEDFKKIFSSQSIEKIVLNPPKELLLFSRNIAGNQIQKHMNLLNSCKWVRAEFTNPSFDSMNFIYKNKIFSVIIDIQDEAGISYLPDEYIKRQLYASRLYNLVPCKFPIIVKNPYSQDFTDLKAKHNGWNLVHTKTGQPIIPEHLATMDKIEMSEWEIRYYSIKQVIKYLKAQNCKIYSFQDILEIDPQIWFEKPTGERCWAIIRSSVSQKKHIKQTKNLNKIIKKCYKYNGYYIGVNISSINNKKIYRNSDYEIQIDLFEQIHSISSIINTNNTQENIHDLILQSITQTPIYTDEYIGVFPMFGNDDLIIKIGRKYLNNLDKLPRDLVKIPIKYDDTIKDNPHFGLHLYYIDRKKSKYAKKGFVDTVNVLNYTNRNSYITILRRMSGQNVSLPYQKSYEILLGPNNDTSDYIQYKMLVEISKKYGKKAAIRALDCFAKDLKYIEKNQLTENSPEYHILDGIRFFNNYKNFTQKYFEILEKIHDLPDKTYVSAIQDILSIKNFMLDFVHPNNTFIDYDKEEFQFIDFVFEEKYMKKNPYKNNNPLEDFRDILLGRNFSIETYHPSNLLFFEEDINLYKQLVKQITEKINNVAPDKYKIKEEI